MRPVLQQLGIPFSTVRHALRNRSERFCRAGLATMGPGGRVVTLDRDRHCAPAFAISSCNLSARLQPVGLRYHAAIRANFDPFHRNWRARRAQDRLVATATDGLESDA